MIKETRMIMGMPITLMTPHQNAQSAFEKIFQFFNIIDQRYSPFIESSDVSKINRHELDESVYSLELHEILDYADQTKRESNGYFDVWHDGKFDPSGIVKGWAIQKACYIMREHTDDFYIEAGGDIQVYGVNDQNQPWQIGIRNPFNRDENISVITLNYQAVATSGTAIRGAHIYDPVTSQPLTDIISLSVIAPNIIDADRMATAAFAMGRNGIDFIEKLNGYEGYMVDSNKRATTTTGWNKYEVQK